ncbi:MAG: hypothetical protein RRC34_00620 [Lentisphaeria bacterium]|nr:hypothetical protein [Lentisphaeria bacterium]
MKRKHDNLLKESLKASDQAFRFRGKDAFWAEFKARAAATPQDGLSPVPAPRLFAQTWIRAAAAVLVLGVSGVLSVKMMTQAENPEKVSTVQEVDILMDYSSVVILEDTDHGGTFVWITEEDSVDQG